MIEIFGCYRSGWKFDEYFLRGKFNVGDILILRHREIVGRGVLSKSQMSAIFRKRPKSKRYQHSTSPPFSLAERPRIKKRNSFSLLFSFLPSVYISQMPSFENGKGFIQYIRYVRRIRQKKRFGGWQKKYGGRQWRQLNWSINKNRSPPFLFFLLFLLELGEGEREGEKEWASLETNTTHTKGKGMKKWWYGTRQYIVRINSKLTYETKLKLRNTMYSNCLGDGRNMCGEFRIIR